MEIYASINVLPQEGGGGGGEIDWEEGGRGGREGNPREIDIEACSLNGDFDSMKPLLQMQLLQRLDGNLTSNEHPGEVNLTFSFPKISNSPGITPPLSPRILGQSIDWCINKSIVPLSNVGYEFVCTISHPM